MSEISPAAARMSAADRRTQLLEIALNVFAQKGFNGATTKEIAAAAGITEAMIFRHFPSKQALYQAVLECKMGCPGFEKWMGVANDCMERGDDEGLFRAIATAMIEGYRRDARLERILLFAALEGNEQGLEHFRTFSIPIAELLRDYIVRRQQAGALKEDIHSAAILAAVAGMAHRYAMLTQLFKFHVDATDDQVVEAFNNILMNGIKAR